MNPTLMLFTADVECSLAFYQQLGLTVRRVQRGGGWAELIWGDFALNLHEHALPLPDTGRLQLGFEVESGLEDVVARLSAEGLGDLSIIDEGFGRIVHLRDSDGNLLSIVQNEPELYT